MKTSPFKNKLLRLILLLLPIFVLKFELLAQSKKFQGRVISEINSTPFQSALVTILDSDNNSIIKKLTNEEGVFVLDVDNLNNKYIIQIEHIASEIYKDTIDFKLYNSEMLFRMKEKTTILKEVIVKNRIPLITRKADKIIINVENNSLLDGKNSLNLLQMTPGLQFTNQEISINGIPGATIYINDIPLRLSGLELQNYLNNLKSNDIKAIEILPRPSAEFSAEGAGGIINIVLKKPINTGLSGNLGFTQSFGLGKFPSSSPNTSFNFKLKKLQLSARYNYLDKKDFFSMSQNRTLLNKSEFTSRTERIQDNIQNNTNLTLDYEITKNQNLGLYYFGTFSKDNQPKTSITTIDNLIASENLYSLGSFESISNINYNNIGINYGLFVDSLKSKLTVLMDYTKNNKAAINTTNSQIFNTGNVLVSDTLYNYNFPCISKIRTVDIKYLKVFKSGTELKIGSKYSSININTQNSFEIFKNSIGTINPLNSFNFKYSESIFASFVELNGKFKTVDYKIGLRGENTKTIGILSSQTQNSNNLNDYFNLFPSFYIGKDLDKKNNHNLSLSINRRIARPSYNALNPYQFFVDNYTLTSGNPNLRPSIINGGSIGYTYLNKYNLGVSISRISNQISRIYTTNNSNLINQIWENVGETVIYGSNISAPIEITDWWSSNNSLLFQYKKIKDPNYQLNKGTFVLQTYNEYTISKNFNMSFSGFYSPRSIYGNIITAPYSNISIGLSKKIFKEKVNLNVSIDDLFYQNNPSMISYFNNQTLTQDLNFQTRNLILSLSYNFKAGLTFKKKNIEKSSLDESNRL